MWITYEDYKEYLLGREAIIPDSEFPFWAKKAEQTINQRKEEIDPPDFLKECACEVAEKLYQHSKTPIAGSVISESNDGDSWKIKEAEKKDQQAELDEIIDRHLAGTSLQLIPYPYRGV